MSEYCSLNIVTNTNIPVNEYSCFKQRIRMSESLLTFICYYVGVCEKLKH